VSPNPNKKETNEITPIQNKFRLDKFSESEIEQIRKVGLELIHGGKGILF